MQNKEICPISIRPIVQIGAGDEDEEEINISDYVMNLEHKLIQLV